MSYTIKGSIVKIFDKQTLSEKFEKKEFAIKTEEDYPQFIKFTLTNKLISLIDEYKEGDDIIVDFNITGKEDKNGNFWNNLSVWRLRKTKDAPIENNEQKKTKKKIKNKESILEHSFKNPSQKDKDMPF